MTIEKCAAACSAFTKFGVEYARECYCGNELNDGSVSTSISECSFDCPGDSSEKCGAGNRLNVYTRPVSTPTLLTTYTSKGCISEPQNARALAAKTFNDAAMTVELCATGCAGYAYFGLEYFHECYCSNFIAPGSLPLASDKCSLPCDGNAQQTCGGNWALSLYSFDSASSSSTTTSSSAPTATTPASSTFTADGCYTDSVASRALTGAQFFDDGMTVAICQSICSNFAIFGVEYGRECYCGNSLNGGSVQAASADCYFPCAGDPTATCGAGDRLNLYRKALTLPSSSSTSSSTTTTEAASTTVRYTPYLAPKALY